MPDTMIDQIAEHQRVIAAVMGQIELLERVADEIIACFQRGGRVYIVGNGGSAADAQHIAAELVGRFKRNRQALPVIALTTDSSVITAVTNDLGGEHCFERQVEALLRDNDILWALSVSGTSPNVIRAVRSARRIGAMVVGFSGRTGGDLAALCDVCFLADHDASDRVQEAHQLAYHLVCDRIERAYSDRSATTPVATAAADDSKSLR